MFVETPISRYVIYVKSSSHGKARPINTTYCEIVKSVHDATWLDKKEAEREVFRLNKTYPYHEFKAVKKTFIIRKWVD